MRAFAIWLLLTLAAFGGLGGGYHLALSSDPHRILVVVDSSFAMKPDWPLVSGILDRIERRRYARFALATEKGPVHGYAPHIGDGRMTPYAPRDFSKLKTLGDLPELAGAQEYILITNAPAGDTRGLGGWTVIRP